MATCWQTAILALYEIGAPATVAQVEMHTGGVFSGSHAFDTARRHGVAKCSAPRETGATWTLTQKGVDWCENRLRTVEQRRMPGRHSKPQFVGMRFVPTWLAALPRGIRLTPPEPEPDPC